MLTKQLKELEADGLINQTVFPEVPPRVEYGLTELGREMKIAYELELEYSQSFSKLFKRKLSLIEFRKRFN